MDIFECINKRTSVRAYLPKAVEKEKINTIIKAGVRAPSGKNGQPWRFAVLQDNKELLIGIASMAAAEFIKKADCLIFVYLDKNGSYNYIKDSQAIGSCIENMLLAVEALELGACWIGELNGKDTEIKKLLDIEEQYELAAVLTLGYPAFERKNLTSRKPLSEVILKEL